MTPKQARVLVRAFQAMQRDADRRELKGRDIEAEYLRRRASDIEARLRTAGYNIETLP